MNFSKNAVEGEKWFSECELHSLEDLLAIVHAVVNLNSSFNSDERHALSILETVNGRPSIGSTQNWLYTSGD